MAEDVARAVGAKDGMAVMVDGKECTIRPLSIVELAEIERECVSNYRKEFLQAWKDTLEFFPEDQRLSVMQEKINEAAKFELKTLPVKYAYDPKHIELTNDMRKWIDENMSAWVEEFKDSRSDRIDQFLRSLAVQALEQGLLSEETYSTLAKKPVKKNKVGYVHWWVSNTMPGRLAVVYPVFRDNGLTREQIKRAVSNGEIKLDVIQEAIQALSVPEAGNG